MTDTFTAVFTDEEGNVVFEEEFDNRDDAYRFCVSNEDNGHNSDVRDPDGNFQGVN